MDHSTCSLEATQSWTSHHLYRMAPLRPRPSAIGRIPACRSHRRTEDLCASSIRARVLRLTVNLWLSSIACVLLVDNLDTSVLPNHGLSNHSLHYRRSSKVPDYRPLSSAQFLRDTSTTGPTGIWIFWACLFGIADSFFIEFLNS